MQQAITDLLVKKGKASFMDLKNELSDYGNAEINNALQEMIKSLKIVQVGKKYELMENSNLIVGKISIPNEKYGFVRVNGGKDIFVSSKNFNRATNGDNVAVKLIKEGDKPVGKVIAVKSLIGVTKVAEFVSDAKGYRLILDDRYAHYNVFLKNEPNIVDGTKVVIKIDEKISSNEYICSIDKVLGHKNDADTEYKSILIEKGVDFEFNDAVKDEVKNIKNHVDEEDIEYLRKHKLIDLRDQPIVTIDCDDTKDIDDAVILIINERGNYELITPIADVSYYVKNGSAIMLTALNRCLSVYLPGVSVPMLPRELSNGICSLNPDVDRLALAFHLEIAQNGTILKRNVYECIINSKMKMKYSEANEVVDNDKEVEGYEQFKDQLLLIKQLTSMLRKQKIQKGFVDFDITESEVILDENRKAIDIKARERGTFQKAIEDLMVLDGIEFAKWAQENNVNLIFRNHDDPDLEKFTKLYNVVVTRMLKKPIKVFNASGKTIQKIVAAGKETEQSPIINRTLLRSMKKASYGADCVGHFALGTGAYAQFTSPIRRIGDLVNHILIKDYIYNRKPSFTYDQLKHIAYVASMKERIAADTENEAKKLKIAQLMQSEIGNTFTGIISGLTKRGIYILLNDKPIEGFIPIESLSDRYQFNEDNICLEARGDGKNYHLGDIIPVTLTDTNTYEREIYFNVNEKVKVKKLSKK